MSSAIPKALFSIGVKAPAADARLQSPSDSVPESFSSWGYLGSQGAEQICHVTEIQNY